MKYAKVILLSLAVGVLLDILIDVLIPDRGMNVVFVVTMSVLLLALRRSKLAALNCATVLV